jgi:membrane associated rhomboid family serine protease
MIALTIAIHLVLLVMDATDPGFRARVIDLFAVKGGIDFRWWGLVTSAFLHGGWLHLAGNMIFLRVFGPAVEDRFGSLGFLAFYLFSAAVSGGAHALIEVRAFEFGPGGQTVMRGVPAIGASGAIAAVTGVFLVLFPNSRIRVLWLLGFSITYAPAWWVIGLGVAWNLLAVGVGADRGIAHIAHLAGYGFGFALSMALLAAHVLPRDPADLLTTFKHAHRRRRFKAALAPSSQVPLPVRSAAQPPDPMLDAIAEQRAEISTLLSQQRFDDAASAYGELCQKHATRLELLTLARNAQASLAAHLYASNKNSLAAFAMERFIETYPNDRESDHMRILLSRLYRERLGRREEARTLLDAVLASSTDPTLREVALRDLGAATTSPEQAS